MQNSKSRFASKWSLFANTVTNVSNEESDEQERGDIEVASIQGRGRNRGRSRG